MSEFVDDHSVHMSGGRPPVLTVSIAAPLDPTSVGRLATEELWKRKLAGAGCPARDELARRYLPLARKLAARYTNPNEALEDPCPRIGSRRCRTTR